MKFIDKAIEYGFYLLVFLLPVQTRLIIKNFAAGSGGLGNGFVEYLGFSLYAVDSLLIFLLILFSIKYFKNLDKFLIKKIKKQYWLIAGMDFFIFVSIFFSPDKGLAIYRYLLFLASLGLFFLVIEIRYNKRKLFFSFLSSLFIQSVFAIWQFFNQKTPAFKWLGLASHNSSDLGVSVIETLGDNMIGERWLRAYGSFDHPNILGAVLAIGLIMISYGYLKYKRQEKTKLDWKFIIYNLSFIILFTAILLSFSRSAWLALAMSFLFIFSIYLFKKDFKALAKIFKASLIPIVLFIMIFYSYSNLFITRISGEGRLEDKSDYEREYYLNESKVIIKNNFFFGAGIGNYIVKEISLRKDDYFWTYQPVHNTFLLALAEIGIFGFLFFVGFLIWILAISIKKKKYFNIAVLLVLFIIMLFDHWLWSLHFGSLFFWLIMGILVKNLEKNKIQKIV